MGIGRVFLPLLVLAGGAACSLITSYDGFAPTGGAAPVATCGARIPTKPTTASSTEDGTFQRAAMKSIQFAPVGDQVFGFDLDENCSKPACTSRRPAADVKIGVDNVIGPFIGRFLDPKADVAFTDDALKNGRFGLFVEISKWNQQRNDSAVTVSLYNVVGVNAGGTKEAAFNGSDAYVVSAEEVKSGPIPGSVYQAYEAYVTQGTLVARFDEFPLRLLARVQNGAVAGILRVLFVNAALVAKVTPTGTGTQITEAQLVGRIEASELLRDIARLGPCPAGVGDAGAGDGYNSNKGLLCGILDLTSSKATDGAGKKCVAASVAFGVDFVGTTVAPAGGPAPSELDECPGAPPDTCD